MSKLVFFFIAIVALLVWFLPSRQLLPGEAAFVQSSDASKAWCFVPSPIAPEFRSAVVRTKHDDTNDPQPPYLILVGMYFIAFYAMTTNGRFMRDVLEFADKLSGVALACVPTGALLWFWNRRVGDES